MRTEKGKVLLGPLKEEAYKEYKEKVRTRRELFKDLWIACEKHVENVVYELIKELLEEKT
ncbi:MAG TPA: hypothetical protein ENF55_01935 [Thermoprotei archaeon]|nr:hypothetical protein [Thermoprotei archaeon]